MADDGASGEGGHPRMWVDFCVGIVGVLLVLLSVRNRLTTPEFFVALVMSAIATLLLFDAGAGGLRTGVRGVCMIVSNMPARDLSFRLTQPDLPGNVASYSASQPHCSLDGCVNVAARPVL